MSVMKTARHRAPAVTLTLALQLLCAIPAPAEQNPTIQLPDGRTVRVHHGRREDPPNPAPLAQLHPRAAAALAQPYAGPAIDVTSFHYDGLRTGWNPSETALTPATVASPNFGLLRTLTVDGNVFAQPLLVSGFTMPDTSVHDVLLIATGHNTLYAYDAQSYALLWSRNLGKAQATGDVGCGDVQPEYGISSTPVIVRNSAASATVYVIAATEPNPYEFHTQLHAIELATGNDVKAVAEIQPTAQLSGGTALNFNAQYQWSRAGLVWANSSLYVAIGSHCDNGANAISGWLLRYSSELAPMASFHTINDAASYELASIWMSGFAPAVDAQGALYVITGNGSFDAPAGGRNYGESVLKLPADLSGVSSSFTPANFNALNQSDQDFGSGGVMLLPSLSSSTPPLALAMGKDPVAYLLNRNALGGLRPNNAGVLQALPVASRGFGVWGGPAYFAAPAGPTVYYQINNDVLRSYRVSTGAAPKLSAAAAGTSAGGYGGSMPIVSSNGSAAGTGVVWLIRRASTVQLEAYDAEKLGAPIYAAGAGSWSNSSNNAFVSAMEANGRVYVGAYGTVSVFGLTPP